MQVRTNIEVKFLTFHPVKIKGRMDEMSESVCRAWPGNQPLIYFWRGGGAQGCSVVWEIRGLVKIKDSGKI